MVETTSIYKLKTINKSNIYEPCLLTSQKARKNIQSRILRLAILKKLENANCIPVCQ